MTKLREVKVKTTKKSTIVYLTIFLICLAGFIFESNVSYEIYETLLSINGIILFISMFGMILSLLGLAYRGVGTYQYVQKTGTQKQIEHADFIYKTIVYSFCFTYVASVLAPIIYIIIKNY